MKKINSYRLLSVLALTALLPLTPIRADTNDFMMDMPGDELQIRLNILTNHTTVVSNMLNGAEFTPTAWQASSNLTPVVTYAKYYTVGALCVVSCTMGFSKAGVAGQNLVVSNLPPGNIVCGSANYHDSGSARYSLSIDQLSSNSVVFYGYNVASPFGTTPSVAVSTSDSIKFTLIYEGL